MSQRPELFVPPIVLDKRSSVSLQRQIHRQIAQAIRGDAVHYEARLPSTRVMARLLRVSRNTVFAAYEDLAADDLIRGARGSGMRIASVTPDRSASGAEMTMLGLQRAIRAASYPARILALADPDGNSLYIRF